MGGALILFAIVVSTIAVVGPRAIATSGSCLLVTLGFGVIGWIDDYRKLMLKDSKGLPARWKYLAAVHRSA